MTIAELILTTAPIDTPVDGVDTLDPTVGSGSTMSEMDAPADYAASAFTFDPWVA